MKTSIQKNNRRYRLHQLIKAQFRYSAKKKTVYVPFDFNEVNQHVEELKNKFHYNIQFEIV